MTDKEKEIIQLVKTAEETKSNLPYNSKITIVLKANPPAKQIVASKDKEFLEVGIKGDATIGFLMNQLRKKFPDVVKDNTFIFYCNSFALCPSSYIRDLYNNFGVGGQLIISYNIIETWG